MCERCPERDTAHVIASRLTAQLLAGPPGSGPVEVAERLLAIQSQDPRGARLAVRARTVGTRAFDVDAALTDDRALVITWLNRGTLHLVRAEDYWWLHALTTPPLMTGNARRLSQEGVTPDAAERGVTVVRRSLEKDGPLTRVELRGRIAASGVPVAGQALVHILMLASLRGHTVRGPMVGNDQAYVLVQDWLGKGPKPLDRDASLAELSRRYLAGHGPATDRDLAKWAGLPLRDVRRGLSRISGELVHLEEGLVDLSTRPPAAELPPPRLLGTFEPVLLGWTSRELILRESARTLVTDNGLFRAFALVGGRAVATWSLRRSGGSLQPEDIALTPFAELAENDREALQADAEDVVRFLSPV